MYNPRELPQLREWGNRAVMEGKVGVASGGGMRLKARLSRPPAAGTYPPAPTTATIGKNYRERGIGGGYGAGGG